MPDRCFILVAARARNGEDLMNRSTLTAAFALFTLLSSVTLSAAQQYGSPAEAKAMFDRAITALKGNEGAALAAFNDKNNKDFHDRDLYMFCFRMSDGVYVAHTNPALMGTDSRQLKILGEPVGARVYAAAKEGNATLEYNFPRPGTTEAVPKVAYVTHVGDVGCGVGYYK
jgi:hypothetical protein